LSSVAIYRFFSGASFSNPADFGSGQCCRGAGAFASTINENNHRALAIEFPARIPKSSYPVKRDIVTAHPDGFGGKFLRSSTPAGPSGEFNFPVNRKRKDQHFGRPGSALIEEVGGLPGETA